MRLNSRLCTIIAATGTLALAMPALAHPAGHGGSGKGGGGAGGNSHSHKCKPHNVGYVEAGKIDSATASTLAQNQDGTWTGTLVVDVKHANRWAKGDKNTTVTYTFTNANVRVRFHGGTSGFAAGERVQLI